MGAAALPMMIASQLMGGIEQHDQLRAGAAVDDENARRTQLAGAYEEAAAERHGRAVSGEAIAALAGNGVAVGSGSAQDLLFQNAMDMNMDVLAKRYSAGSEAAALRTQAGQKRYGAKMAIVNSVFRAGAAAIQGMSEQGSAGAAEKAAAIEREARFPGAQKLPMPGGYAEYHGPSFPVVRDPLSPGRSGFFGGFGGY